MADLLQELMALKDRMNRVFENALARSNFKDGTTLPVHWNPSVDIFETNDTMVLQAELPGLLERDIDITVTDHTLSIAGERAMAKEMHPGNFHRIERSYGSFHIEVPLQTPIVRDGVRATYLHGVLEVTLPKVGRERTRPVKVKLN